MILTGVWIGGRQEWVRETSYETERMVEFRDDNGLDQGVCSENGERQID